MQSSISENISAAIVRFLQHIFSDLPDYTAFHPYRLVVLLPAQKNSKSRLDALGSYLEG
jgi:hypothetical protein